MAPGDPNLERLVQCIAESQGRLYAYIRTLVPDAEVARDVLQETNLVLWRKSEQFRPGTNFAAWACRIALFQVRAMRRDSARDRHVFDEQLVAQLALAAESRTAEADRREGLLRDCLRRLSPRQRDVIRHRYGLADSVGAIADRLRTSPGAIANVLHRARRSLMECVNRTLAKERHT